MIPQEQVEVLLGISVALSEIRSVPIGASGIYRDSVWTAEVREVDREYCYALTHWPTCTAKHFKEGEIHHWIELDVIVYVAQRRFEVYLFERISHRENEHPTPRC